MTTATFPGSAFAPRRTLAARGKTLAMTTLLVCGSTLGAFAPTKANAQFTGQTAESTCNAGSFMVGDVNTAIENVFADVAFIAGPLCSIMNKMVLVTIILGFGILVWAGVDSHAHQKGFSSALSPFFNIIISFMLAWLLIGFYSINQAAGPAGAGIQGGFIVPPSLTQLGL